MSLYDSKVDALKKLVEVQDRIRKDEFRGHLLYIKIMLATGLT